MHSTIRDRLAFAYMFNQFSRYKTDAGILCASEIGYFENQMDNIAEAVRRRETKSQSQQKGLC